MKEHTGIIAVPALIILYYTYFTNMHRHRQLNIFVNVIRINCSIELCDIISGK